MCFGGGGEQPPVKTPPYEPADAYKGVTATVRREPKAEDPQAPAQQQQPTQGLSTGLNTRSM